MTEDTRLLDREALRREVEKGARLKDALTSLASEAREKIIFSYTGAGGVAAWIAYWFVKQLAPGVSVEIQPGDALAFHVLAYRESRDEYSPASDTTVYLFVGPGGENQSIMVRDASLYTGARLAIISPRLPPLLRDRLGEEPRLLELDGVYTILAPIAAALLALEIGESRGYSGTRVKRVEREVLTLTEVLDDLLERFSDTARRAAECRSVECTVIYTPTMRSAAILHSLLYGSRPLGVQDALAAFMGGVGGRVLLMYTRGDADAVREVRFRALSRGASLVEVVMPTDPLTAPIYTILVLHARSVD